MFGECSSQRTKCGKTCQEVSERKRPKHNQGLRILRTLLVHSITPKLGPRAVFPRTTTSPDFVKETSYRKNLLSPGNRARVVALIIITLHLAQQLFHKSLECAGCSHYVRKVENMLVLHLVCGNDPGTARIQIRRTSTAVRTGLRRCPAPQQVTRLQPQIQFAVLKMSVLMTDVGGVGLHDVVELVQ